MSFPTGWRIGGAWMRDIALSQIRRDLAGNIAQLQLSRPPSRMDTSIVPAAEIEYEPGQTANDGTDIMDTRERKYVPSSNIHCLKSQRVFEYLPCVNGNPTRTVSSRHHASRHKHKATCSGTMFLPFHKLGPFAVSRQHQRQTGRIGPSTSPRSILHSHIL